MLCFHYNEIRNLENLRSLRIKKTQALYKILADNLKKIQGHGVLPKKLYLKFLSFLNPETPCNLRAGRLFKFPDWQAGNAAD